MTPEQLAEDIATHLTGEWSRKQREVSAAAWVDHDDTIYVELADIDEQYQRFEITVRERR